jgi:hypothetical protein
MFNPVGVVFTILTLSVGFTYSYSYLTPLGSVIRSINDTKKGAYAQCVGSLFMLATPPLFHYF